MTKIKDWDADEFKTNGDEYTIVLWAADGYATIQCPMWECSGPMLDSDKEHIDVLDSNKFISISSNMEEPYDNNIKTVCLGVSNEYSSMTGVLNINNIIEYNSDKHRVRIRTSFARNSWYNVSNDLWNKLKELNIVKEDSNEI